MRDHVWNTQWSLNKAGKERLEAANALCEFFGPNTPLSDCVKEEAQARFAKSMRSRGRANGTIINRFAALKTMMKRGQKMGVVPGSAEIIKIKNSPSPRMIVLPAQEKIYFQAIRDLQLMDYHDLALVYRDMGMRKREPLLAKWGAWRDNTARIGTGMGDTKADKPRTIPMTDRVKAMIERRRVTHKNQAGPFSNITLGQLRGWYRKVGDKAEMEWITPHIWRHTAITFWMRRKIDVATIQAWAGHSDIETTMGYVHLVDEVDARDLAAINIEQHSDKICVLHEEVAA
jgi:integrase